MALSAAGQGARGQGHRGFTGRWQPDVKGNFSCLGALFLLTNGVSHYN
jgi:hypothetical protein